MSQVPLTPLFPTPPQNGYNNDHLPPLRPTPIKFINDNSYSHSNSHHNHNHHHYHQLHPQLNSVNNITTTHKQFNTNLTPSYSKNTPTTYSQTQSRLSTSNSTYIRYHSPIEPEITPSSTPLQLGNTHSISQISEDNYNQYNPFLRSNRNSKIYLGNNPQPEIHGHNIRINTPELPPELPPTVTTSSMSGHSIYSPESIRSAPITSDPPKFNANQVNTNEYNYNNNKPHSRSTFSLQFHSQKNKRKRKQPHNTTLRTRALSAQPPIKHQHQHQKTQLRNVQSNQGGQVLNVLNTLNLRDTYSGSGSISVSQSKSNEYTNSNSFMVFQPNQSNNSHDEIDVLDRIGLSDFKQNEYVEMDMPSHKPQLQRAGTAPNHTKINSHNNPYTNTYGFNMNKIERRKHNQKQVQSQYHRYNLHSSKQIQLQSQSHGQSHQRHACHI